jgi:hypothetical protein
MSGGASGAKQFVGMHAMANPPNMAAVAASIVDEAPPVSVKKFWIGTTLDAPAQNIDLGGICFPRFTRKRVEGDKAGMDELSSPLPGCMIDLDEETVRRIYESVALRIVRWGREKKIKEINPFTGEATEVAARRGEILSKDRKLTERELEEQKKLNIYLPRFRGEPGDVSVGCYCYMVPVDKLPQGFVYGATDPDTYQPPTLVPRDNPKLKY